MENFLLGMITFWGFFFFAWGENFFARDEKLIRREHFLLGDALGYLSSVFVPLEGKKNEAVSNSALSKRP